jgi:hypothetical protein
MSRIVVSARADPLKDSSADGRLIDVSKEHRRNANGSRRESFEALPNVTTESERQSEKQNPQRASTDDGISIDDSE